MRPPTPADVEQLAHVAADADGAPLSDEDFAFLAAPQDALRVDEFDGRLVVLGVASTTYYRAVQVRAAVAHARRIWRLTQAAHLPIPGRLPDPTPPAAIAEDTSLTTDR